MKKLWHSPKRKQKKQESQQDFTATNTGSSVSQPEPTPATGTLLTCKTMMLDAFIDAYCNDVGMPENWSEIVQEYAELMGNGNLKRAFEIADKILRLTVHIRFVKECVKYFRACIRLKRTPDAIVEERLNELYQCDVRDEKSLRLVKSLVKTRFYELSILSDEAERLNASATGERQTEGDFNKDIMHLAKFQGWKIDKKTTTVAEYAAIYNNFIQEIKNKDAAGG